MLRFDDQNRLLKIGVHDLIDAGPSSGHLRMQVNWSGRTRMQMGTDIHNRWQDARTAEDASFRREVRIQHSLVVRDWEVRISGRVDGLSEQGGRIVIEEVKSSTLPGSRLVGATAEDFPAYIRQLQLYLHFMAAQGESPIGRLIFISIPDGTHHTLDVPQDPGLDTWMVRQLDWIILQHEERLAWLARRRTAVAAGLPFPHDTWRTGQPELAASVQEALHQSKTLLLAAPTGYGKTAAALHAALTVAYERDLRVFFATARTTQQLMAEEVVSEMARRGMPLRAVSIRAREKICLNEVVACRPDACKYAEDYHDRIRTGDLIHKAWDDPPGCASGVPRPDAVVKIAEAETVCPFALSLDLAGQADVLIGDYNYIFDPGTRLSLIDDAPGSWLIVVDEAHNLPERAMGYGSPELSLMMAESAASALAAIPGGEPFAAVMVEIAGMLAEGVAEIPQGARDGEMALPLDEGLDKGRIAELIGRIEQVALEYALFKLDRAPFPPGETDPFSEVSRAVIRLRSALERADDETVVIWRRSWKDRRMRMRRPKVATSQMSLLGGGHSDAVVLTGVRGEETGLKLLCRDPAGILGPLFDKLAGAVCMSATLAPEDFYRAMFGVNEDNSAAAEFPSPFPPEQRQVLIAPGVSTEYRRRDRDRESTAALISEAILTIPGNVAIFFPSFAFRESMLPYIDIHGRPVLLQERSMGETARIDLINTMAKGEGHVLMAVLGGIFSEGIDLPGSALVGVVVVGPSLPQANLSRRLMQQWYQERYQQGFRYAWLVPGMSRVIQAAGRLIRTSTDRGSVVLIGRRFLQRDYQAFFPGDWSAERTRKLGGSLVGFWGVSDPPPGE